MHHTYMTGAAFTPPSGWSVLEALNYRTSPDKRMALFARTKESGDSDVVAVPVGTGNYSIIVGATITPPASDTAQDTNLASTTGTTVDAGTLTATAAGVLVTSVAADNLTGTLGAPSVGDELGVQTSGDRRVGVSALVVAAAGSVAGPTRTIDAATHGMAVVSAIFG